MGQVLRREHEGKRSAFAALLTTGMLAALLAFAALAAPSPAYAAELQSLSLAPQLAHVVVSPADQAPSAAEQAKFTAYTNVDGMSGATMAYTWEMRDLDSTPDDSNAWTTLAGKTTREIKLDPGATGYVRCTVTYTPPADVLELPLNAPVTSTNEARVRIMPAAPANLTTADMGQTTAKVSWAGDANGAASDLRYRVVGSGEWTSKSGLSSASADLIGLKPGTTYEWNVRSAAYGASSDPLCSDWVAGPLFTTERAEIVFSRAWVTPSATSVMAGAEDTVTLTANTDADTGTGSERLAYQWQRSDGSAWSPVDGATAATLQVSARDLPVGEHIYRCEVTATRGGSTKTLDSSESVVTATPAVPTGLSVSDDFPYVDPDNQSGQVNASFSWTWDNTTLPEGARFEVNYRKLAGAGAINDEWLSEGLTVNDASRTCQAVLEARNITYQWRVRVVQNGATSPWSGVDTFITAQDESADELSSVQVTPSDSLASNDDTVTLTASTNVTDDSAFTYAWEWCELKTNDPRKGETVWTSMDGKTSKEITLSGNERNRYVRCKVTQTGGETTKTVASNLACVRTEPMAPENASAKTARAGTYDSNSCTSLSWDCPDPRAKDNAQQIVLGYEVNYRKVGASEWVEKICNVKNCPLTSLESDATYEWRVRTILSDNVSGEGGYNPSVQKVGPYSEWVDGLVFTAPKVVVTPTEAATVIGSDRTLTFTAMPNALITNDRREKTYQWERYDGTEWAPMSGATSETLSIAVTDAATAGASRYRCKVTLGDGEYSRVVTTSNEVTCTLTLSAPTNLAASDITSGKATLSWNWAEGGSQTADEFKVFYRENSATEWEPATAPGNVRELALEGLKPETVYEWYVQAVQNGVESQQSSTSLFVTASLKLESVQVAPGDQTVAPGAQATVKATTNLDGVVDAGELAYVWEKRALDSDPNASGAWEEITGETGCSVTLPAKTSGYVRCKVTYTPTGSTAAGTVASNEARVRVQPDVVTVTAPTGLEVKDIGDTAATFAWGGTLPTGGSFTLLYRPAGMDAWTTVPKLTASPYTAQDLDPGTTYEWRMCAAAAGGLTSEWVDGSAFTTLASPEPVDYPVTADANGIWKPGQTGLAFTVDCELDKFVSAAVDGVELVRDTDYTAASGSTILTLSNGYLATLPAGTHTLVATFTDGAAETTFTIAAPDTDPGIGSDQPGSGGNAGNRGGIPLALAGDPLGAALGAAGVLGVVCAALAALSAVLRRKRS